MKSLVAVCDVLGFSKYVASNASNLRIVADSIGLIRRIAAMSLLHQTELQDNVPLHSIQSNKYVGVACFSDSFFFYTKQDGIESCVKLLNTVATMIFLGLRHTGTRIRAGISYGDIEVDEKNSVFVGLPIIDR